jgi:redox-sensing transcriptional repressor
VKVAEPTVERLVQYRRLLDRLMDEGCVVVSSQQIGDMLGFKASQVRKDLSYFGEMGKRGVGYKVSKLRDYIADILLSPRVWRMALAGVGNVGSALLSNAAFRVARVSFEALFETDPQKVGRVISGVRCWHYTQMPEVMRDSQIEVLLLTVPLRAAQSCLDLAVSSGCLKGVLSFTQGTLTAPRDVLMVRVDIPAELEKLLFFLNQAYPPPNGDPTAVLKFSYNV